MDAQEQRRISNRLLTLIGLVSLLTGGMAIFFTGPALYPNVPLSILVIFSLGVSVFPSALVLLLYEVFFRELTSSRLRTELIEEIRKSLAPFAELSKSGLKTVYPNRGGLPERLAELLRQPHLKLVRFCGVQTNTCLHIPNFENTVKAALREQCVFQFLFMDREPTRFNFHAQRDRDEYSDPDRDGTALRQGADDTIRYLLRLANQVPGESHNIQLREYFAFPYVSLFQIDRTILVGPYLYGTPCADMPMLEIEDNGHGDCVFRLYETHFDRLFDNARPITAPPPRAIRREER